MKKIMIQKITQNSWNFWTVNLSIRAKKIVNQLSDFLVRRTGSYRHKKALDVAFDLSYIESSDNKCASSGTLDLENVVNRLRILSP